MIINNLIDLLGKNLSFTEVKGHTWVRFENRYFKLRGSLDQNIQRYQIFSEKIFLSYESYFNQNNVSIFILRDIVQEISLKSKLSDEIASREAFRIQIAGKYLLKNLSDDFQLVTQTLKEFSADPNEFLSHCKKGTDGTIFFMLNEISYLITSGEQFMRGQNCDLDTYLNNYQHAITMIRDHFKSGFKNLEGAGFSEKCFQILTQRVISKIHSKIDSKVFCSPYFKRVVFDYFLERNSGDFSGALSQTELFFGITDLNKIIKTETFDGISFLEIEGITEVKFLAVHGEFTEYGGLRDNRFLRKSIDEIKKSYWGKIDLTKKDFELPTNKLNLFQEKDLHSLYQKIAIVLISHDAPEESIECDDIYEEILIYFLQRNYDDFDAVINLGGEFIGDLALFKKRAEMIQFTWNR